MNDKTKYEIMKNRELLKGYHAADVTAEETDQQQKLPSIPCLQTSIATDTIKLPTDYEHLPIKGTILDLIKNRESRRSYQDHPLSLLELSFLLWSTQGVRHFAGHKNPVTFRNVPSAGSRHTFETYLFINQVESLKKAIYHYLPEHHELELWDERDDFDKELTDALCGQRFASSAPVLFVWASLPYRMEWRYGLKAAKYLLIDAGHVCQNLYLACESIGCATCALGAYDQDRLDDLLGFAPGPSFDRHYTCTIYAAPVGRQLPT
ncbi:MAG: SagB/ThcOx family dehydrogenase [Lachnospiraceae bacterium]|jgi:SagB-type dehydrogenase family enzyme|nr:SagB/ThcOx family dehydrogenase [Lachnospiraceae bacterium]MDE7057577.1 SagB/ThcOx family dehydrogenase [Lachnospiraceae bacterium]